MMAALAMTEVGDLRTIWLYDTFEGMTVPGEYDVEYTGRPAIDQYREELAQHGAWARAPLDDVRANLASTSFSADRAQFVVGRVEDTIPSQAPDQIALLRLDPDWYDSPRHELVHLWPRLSSGGVLIVDDYGHYEGARKAVDEFFAHCPALLVRVDYSARLVIKR